ncbi:8577_t:CDS:2 [Paraglomus occultum]|uniref:8577_t:CDS:1 n=1 Tax=Paraglomus occultum TaxID=144539 RepID=A0A9N8Z552_9GLOM|nr:8577_t:CDS:2 [Paraglomus occultum]
MTSASEPLRPTPILPFMTDKQLSMLVPLLVYWVYSIFYHLISEYRVSLFEPYRIHTPAEIEKRNKVTKAEVIKSVLIQQVLQTLFGLLILMAEDEDMLVDDEAEVDKLTGEIERMFGKLELGRVMAEMCYWYLLPITKFVIAMFVVDSWQYFFHRFLHNNPFLYRHIHSVHHRLYVPYAFGALYNHPLEGFVMDIVGAGLAFKLTGMTTREGMAFFSFATMKTVDDHCGYALPFNPLQLIFGNNAAYHDIHHQSYGIKKNFSQPFFTVWDRLLGTYMEKPPRESDGDESNNKNALPPSKTNGISSNGHVNDNHEEQVTAKRYNLRSRKNV